MKKIASALLISAALSTPAFAADAGTWYGALDYGTWSMSNTSYANPGSLTISGGYRITPAVAAEVGYAMIGDSTLTNAFGSLTLSQSAFKVAAVGTHSLNNQFDLFGKVGFATLSAKIVGSGFYAGINNSASNTNLMFAVGGQYNIDKKFGIRLQYENLGKVKASAVDPGADVTVMSIGMTYNF